MIGGSLFRGFFARFLVGVTIAFFVFIALVPAIKTITSRDAQRDPGVRSTFSKAISFRTGC